MNRMVKKFITRTVLSPLMLRAGRAYIAGPELEDAMAVVRRLAVKGFGTSVCFWSTEEAPPAEVAEAYHRSIRALQAENLDAYVSIKAPSLGYDYEFCLRLARACGTAARLHFDSLGLETADPTLALIDRLIAEYGDISFTLPGRWERSLTDADWAIAHGTAVRVVKGQWIDPANPELDPHLGFGRVIERLAGRARHVAVATHDPKLAKASLQKLLDSGTSCELELLFGLPVERALAVARSLGVGVRLYVPYGYGWLPYSLSQARRNPRILWWIVKDAITNRAGIYATRNGA